MLLLALYRLLIVDRVFPLIVVYSVHSGTTLGNSQ